jgi:sulfate adenylyltransferase subunit 2
MSADLMRALEAESIAILREAIACFERPVLLYSIGKDSTVLLHLLRKAVYPGPIPFPLLHVDTGWKFREMIAFRDRTAQDFGLELIVASNNAAATQGVTPFSCSSADYTTLMKTVALREALDAGSYDGIIGGARRDEEKSRAKERIFSLRTAGHRWDPRRQRPELWDLHNPLLGDGETMRIFPLSNWTELDIWHYIARERIAVVPLYFARPRPVVVRESALIMVDDERLPLAPGETPRMRKVRFRTLGCYPLSGAIESDAETLEQIILEMETSRTSERQGRLIDVDQTASMERKKLEGYF